MNAAERAKNALFVEAIARLPVGGRLSFRARGSSMRPFIEDGNLVEMRKVDPAQASPGDIVVFIHSSQILCHRLLKKRYKHGTWYFLSQGDTLFERDPVFTSQDLLGTVTQVAHPAMGSYSWCSPLAHLLKPLFIAVSFLKDIIKATILSSGLSSEVLYSRGFFRSCLKAVFLLWCRPSLALFHWFSQAHAKA